MTGIVRPYLIACAVGLAGGIALAGMLAFPQDVLATGGANFTACYSDGCMYVQDNPNNYWYNNQSYYTSAHDFMAGIYAGAVSHSGGGDSTARYDSSGYIYQLSCTNGVIANAGYYVDLNVPPSLSAACAASGNSVSLSWSSNAYKQYYMVRIDDTTKNPPGYCSPIPPFNSNWYCGAPGEMIDGPTTGHTGTSLTQSITPGVPYRAWLTLYAYGAWGADSNIVSFTCNAAACTGSIGSGGTMCSGDNTGLTSSLAWQSVSSCTTARKCEYTMPTCTVAWVCSGQQLYRRQTDCSQTLYHTCSAGTTCSTSGMCQASCPSSYSDITVTGANSGTAWGGANGDPYRDDSALAKIVVHAGLLAIGETGTIHRTNTGSGLSFDGSTANGVTTQSYNDSYEAKCGFDISLACTPSGVNHCSGTQVLNSCNTVLSDCASQGATCGGAGVCSCPSSYSSVSVTGASSGSAWGSSPYSYGGTSNNSSIAKAAVHAGLLNVGQAGTININSAGMASSFTGSTANGVTTSSYASSYCGVTLSTYACTGTMQAGDTLCSGDDTGLAADTPYSHVSSCTSGTKCETRTPVCTGSIPANSTACSEDDTGLSGSDLAWQQGTGNACTSGRKCEYTTAYACTGTLPANAAVCSGDDTGLAADTAYSHVNSPSECSGAKCQYYLTCTPSNYCASSAAACSSGPGTGAYPCTKDSSCNITAGSACTYGCTSGSCNPPPETKIQISVTPLLTPKNASVKVAWNTEYVEAGSCSVTGTNGDSWDGENSGASAGSCTSSSQCTSGHSCVLGSCRPGEDSDYILQQTVFTLRCVSSISGQTYSQSATVNVLPTFCEPGTVGCAS